MTFSSSVKQIALVLSIAGTCSAQTAPGIDNAMQAGSTAMQAGHPEDAERRFREAVRLDPQFAPAHLDLGLALVRQGKLESAAEQLKLATDIDTKLAGASMFLGITYFELGRFDDARAALKHELVSDSESAEANMWLGVVELSAGHPESATAPLDKAAELSPDNLDVLDYRGRAHALVSTASYAHLSRLDPDSWHVHRALGQSFADQGQPTKAIAEYQAAVRGNPKNPDLYEALGDEYRRVSQFDAAQTAYATELTLSPDNPVALFNLGSIYIDRDDPAKGLPLIQKAALHFTDHAPVLFYLGLGMAKLDRNQQAIDSFSRAIAADPKGDLVQRAYFEESRVYRKMGKVQESQAALTEFMRLRDASHTPQDK